MSSDGPGMLPPHHPGLIEFQGFLKWIYIKSGHACPLICPFAPFQPRSAQELWAYEWNNLFFYHQLREICVYSSQEVVASFLCTNGQKTLAISLLQYWACLFIFLIPKRSRIKMSAIIIYRYINYIT